MPFISKVLFVIAGVLWLYVMYELFKPLKK